MVNCFEEQLNVFDSYALISLLWTVNGNSEEDWINEG